MATGQASLWQNDKERVRVLATFTDLVAGALTGRSSHTQGLGVPSALVPTSMPH